MVVYTIYEDIKVHLIVKNGFAWDPELTININTADTVYSADVAVDMFGRVHLVYQYKQGSSYKVGYIMQCLN